MSDKAVLLIIAGWIACMIMWWMACLFDPEIGFSRVPSRFMATLSTGMQWIGRSFLCMFEVPEPLRIDVAGLQANPQWVADPDQQRQRRRWAVARFYRIWAKRTFWTAQMAATLAIIARWLGAPRLVWAPAFIYWTMALVLYIMCRLAGGTTGDVPGLVPIRQCDNEPIGMGQVRQARTAALAARHHTDQLALTSKQYLQDALAELDRGVWHLAQLAKHATGPEATMTFKTSVRQIEFVAYRISMLNRPVDTTANLLVSGSQINGHLAAARQAVLALQAGMDEVEEAQAAVTHH